MDETTRAGKLAEMKAWLENLAGLYRVEALLHTAGGTNKAQGTAQCTRFGDGPGLRCIIQGIHRHPAERDRGTLPLLYFGIIPGDLEIQLVVVDKEQVGTWSGPLVGDTVEFSDSWKVCHKTWTSCWVADQVTARPGGRVFLKIAEDQWLQGTRAPPLGRTRGGHSLELELDLFREPAAGAQAPQQPEP